MKNIRNLFVYDHVNKAIIGTKSALKKAGIPGSDESKAFASMIRDYPHYKVVEKDVKKNPSKNSHKGLTMSLVKAYLEIQENADELKEKLKRIENMAKEQKLKAFPLVKRWFIGMFENFDVETAQKEIADYWIEKAVEEPIAQ